MTGERPARDAFADIREALHELDEDIIRDTPTLIRAFDERLDELEVFRQEREARKWTWSYRLSKLFGMDDSYVDSIHATLVESAEHFRDSQQEILDEAIRRKQEREA